MPDAATPWSRLSDHLFHFLEDEADPVVGSWAVGQGIDAPDRQLLRHLLRFLADCSPSSEPLVVLEVGCGAGIELKGLIEDGLEPDRITYTGYDFTPEMIEVCRVKFPGRRFEVRDALMMTEERTADIVVSRAMLEHVEDGTTALANLFRAARTLAVVTWFMRPTWKDTNTGVELVEGFVHRRYAMRELLSFVREECRPALLCRFDFDHYAYSSSVWLLWRKPPPLGALEAVHAYTASEEFQEAVLPVPDRPAESEAEKDRLIEELSALTVELRETSEAWRQSAIEATNPGIVRTAGQLLRAAESAGRARLREVSYLLRR
jgi:SAM-dependent methyltransferase